MLNPKKIKPAYLLAHVVITLGYPAVKAFTAEPNKRLLVFTDIMTIVGMILLIGGIIYSLVLHGTFDLSTYYIHNGVRSFRDLSRRHRTELPQDKVQTVDEFLLEKKEKRKDSFNYPLFLGIVYVLLSIVVAYGFLS